MRQRVRKTREEREKEILDASVRLISERGFYGISLQEIADEVGLTQTGIIHYVGNKAGLLRYVIENSYDIDMFPGFKKSEFASQQGKAGIYLPAYLRYMVKTNSERKTLVRMFAILESEATEPTHPGYNYFVHRRHNMIDAILSKPFMLPDSVSRADAGEVLEMCFNFMDGMQLRWFREPPIDLYEEWLKFEKIIFPSPTWDGYR